MDDRSKIIKKELIWNKIAPFLVYILTIAGKRVIIKTALN